MGTSVLLLTVELMCDETDQSALVLRLWLGLSDWLMLCQAFAIGLCTDGWGTT
jgi:hypothetical protein